MLHKFPWKDVKEIGGTVCFWGRVAGSWGKRETALRLALNSFWILNT